MSEQSTDSVTIESSTSGVADTNSLSDQTVESLAAVMRVLSDPTRIRLIERLEAGGRATVTSLAAQVPGSQQTVSHHLGVLHQAGVVARDRDGLWVHYRLCDWTGSWVLRQLAAGLGAEPSQQG
ncbi:MAG TPA: metalloregulator ArsR/SmtB family transcription factor [Solirubrobacterales bacterium]|jgi:ArsR family transcriptional regulator|nr:metalloregulator ArsR/SmtB family transcription factor [Solirubrobacterales bacterium]